MLIIEFSAQGALTLSGPDDLDIDAWIESRKESFRILGIYKVEYIKVADSAELMRRHIQHFQKGHIER
jgi:hypothetical protein